MAAAEGLAADHDRQRQLAAEGQRFWEEWRVVTNRITLALAWAGDRPKLKAMLALSGRNGAEGAAR